jgi:hypothetical protein
MEHPIADRHFAGCDESGSPGEQAECDQRAGGEFDDRADAHQAQKLLLAGRGAGRKSKQLDEAVREKQHAGNDTQRCQQYGFEAGERCRIGHGISFRGFSAKDVPLRH